MTAPLISVVIPAYNAALTILSTLESVRSQSYRPLEVVVVNDGSRDETVSVVERFASHSTATEGFSVRCVTQNNAGPAKARNVGIQQSQGEFIALIDADDTWTELKTTRQAKLFERYPDVGLTFTDVDITRIRDGLTAHFRMFERKKLGKEFFGHTELVVDPVDKLLRTNFVPTSAVMMRRSVLVNQGLEFNVANRGNEDWELWLRVAVASGFAFLDDVCVFKYEEGQNLSSRAHHMLVMRMGTLDRFIEDFAQLVKTNDTYSRLAWEIYKWGGYNLLQMGDPKRSRTYLAKSLGRSFDWRTVLYYVKTFTIQDRTLAS